MHLLSIIVFIVTTTTPTSTGNHDECADTYFVCMAHATTQRERNVCRAEYLACARRIGDE